MTRDRATAVLGAFIDLHGGAGTLNMGVLQADDGSSIDLAEVADALRDTGDGSEHAEDDVQR